MQIINRLKININNEKKVIYFGIPESYSEKDDMFRLRYDIYSKRGYFNKDLVLNCKDEDEYDRDNKCIYFVAQIDGKTIGTARIIKDEYLPTEKNCFIFHEPIEISSIPRENRAELGRLVVVPYNAIGGKYLPRNLVMLFLLKTTTDYSLEHRITGGYSFIKSKLENKLLKLKIPFHRIRPYEQIYPKNGLLGGYFFQPEDPVIPIYFITEEIDKKIRTFVGNWIVFKKETDDCYVLNRFVHSMFRAFRLL